MSSKFDLIKRMAADKIVEKGLKYIRQDPRENFPRLLSLAKKLAQMETYQSGLEKVEQMVEEEDSVILDYVDRAAELDQKYQENLAKTFFVNSTLLGTSYREEKSEELGASVPYTILLDPTSACNLDCDGCWAGKYEDSEKLSFSQIDRIITEAKELGIYFFVLSGGEPTVYPRLFDIFEAHPDCAFMMYTNGTLIDEEMADRMLEVGNVSPTLSLEGFAPQTDGRRGKGTFGKIERAMELLKERGILFGTSFTVTRENCHLLTKDTRLIEALVEKGAFYTWLFHYIPIGSNPDPELMITPEQREELVETIPEVRSNYPLFIVDFWNDGYFTNGCIAGGQRYFHINASGDVEPCAFVHFAVENIEGKSLTEILQNPLFKEYQDRIPFNDNLYRPCPIIDNPEELKDMVDKTGAEPTHEGADNIFEQSVYNKLKKKAEKWGEISRPHHYKRMCQSKIKSSEIEQEIEEETVSTGG